MIPQLERKQNSGNGRIAWGVVGPKGGVHFWVTEQPIDKWGYAGGVEQHWREPEPGSWHDGRPCSHELCWLLDAPCWHDGSSLYASEFFIPLWQQGGEEAVWRQLEREYRKRFEAEVDQ